MAHRWTADHPQPPNDPLAMLDYIDTYQRAHAERAPLQSRIRTTLDISTASLVQATLQHLVRAKLLTIMMVGHRQRAELRVTEIGYERLRAWRAARDDSAQNT